MAVQSDLVLVDGLNSSAWQALVHADARPVPHPRQYGQQNVMSRPHVQQTGDFEPLSVPVGIAGVCPSSIPALIPDYYGSCVAACLNRLHGRAVEVRKW